MSRPPLFAIPVSASTAGIVVSSHSGDRVVASSRRPDGTIRKEVKIRPGYTPDEDVQRYRSTHMAASASGRKPGIPGMTAAVTPSSSSSSSNLNLNSKGSISTSKSKAQKKNEKRKEKRREDGAVSEDEEAGPVGTKEEVVDNWDDGEDTAPVMTTTTSIETKVEAVIETVRDPIEEGKKVKALQKKLRQAEQLREKSEAGMYILPEQREKVEGIAELVKELAGLMLSTSA